MTLSSSQTTRSTCSTRSRSRTTAPVRSSTSTSRWKAGPACTSTHHTPRAWVVGSEVRGTPSTAGSKSRRTGGSAVSRRPAPRPSRLVATASASWLGRRARVRRAGHVARETDAVTEPSWRSGRRSTATAPPITGSPSRRSVKRTTSSPVTVRVTVPPTSRVPGSATPTSAPYRASWARAASRADMARVTAGLRPPLTPTTRASPSVPRVTLHRPRGLGREPGQGPVSRATA